MTSWQAAAENTNRNNADNKKLGTAMAFEGDPVQRAADEIEFALGKDDDNNEGASSRPDHPIRMQ
jgi:hypothetical protein